VADLTEENAIMHAHQGKQAADPLYPAPQQAADLEGAGAIDLGEFKTVSHAHELPPCRHSPWWTAGCVHGGIPEHWR